MRALLLILLLISPLGQAKTLLVLGDSLSAGYGLQTEQTWVKLLSDRLAKEAPDWQLVNASISGETTGGALRRLPAILKEHQPDLVLIELGGNDGLRGYPLGRMKANLAQLVSLSRQAGSQVLLMEIWLPPNYGPRYLDAFKASFGQVAKAKDVPLLPFFLKDLFGKDGMVQGDGLHPTAQAQPALMENIWADLKDRLD
ncbi:arylesterase [Gallaecimonas kandeliae]|uniref:arylesterase n=1 Tax=Gallaecimonas kandeliae TaxID=3029055 RepID=UPI0026495769|nr:arylesterase [Gallaecimonas kandeliae]WKE64278.1 arylesterase [Gallaecimonas kandeliae]